MTEERSAELQKSIEDLNTKMLALQTQTSQPFLNTKQVIATVVACVTSIFAVGAWAQSTRSSIGTIEYTLLTMQADVKTGMSKLNTMDVLTERVNLLANEVDRLRADRDRDQKK